MKHLVLLTLLSINLLVAQQRDPRTDRFDVVPGQLIVKLKDHVDAKISYNKSGIGSTKTNIGKLLGIADKVTHTQVLFHEQAIDESVQRKMAGRKDPRIPELHTLKNTFLLELKDTHENVHELTEQLNNNPLVEYAEPNYQIRINDYKAEGPVIYPNKTAATTNTAVPNDALYSQQNNIIQTKLDKVWEKYGTGNGNQVIAILDTGVDYKHPDLAPNLWQNTKELNGVPGFDDDGNGFIDDFYGWDFINIDNEPLDDNMHGTHVAGIAGAVGGNGIGIAGAAWNVKLMPIKVFQSNGVGNASTIAQGITYAAMNGATILNMSFGSYAESLTLRNALENAYASSVLVASAGNSGICIGPGFCPDKQLGLPSYPAAYTYVLGVEDNPKPPFGYTNYDQDGPIFSKYSNLLNYELTAPGSAIMSTVPNGGYRSLTGTSMAAPLVAGGIALYLQQKPADSKELLFGNLINTATGFVDFEKAIEVVPTPELKVLSATTKDVINNQNGNSFIEPGETIEIFPLIKNYWGPTNDVRVGIEFAEFEDQTKATIVESEIAIGSITAYATLQDLTKSLKIKIANNLANNVNIKFNLMVWSGPDKEYLSKTEYVINVKNAVLLFGVINYNLTLYADKEYLVSDNLAFVNSSQIIIKPGVKIKVSDGKRIAFNDNTSVMAIGKKDSLIIIDSESNGWNGFISKSNNTIIFDYAVIKNIYSNTNIVFDGNPKTIISNSTIENCIGTFLFGGEIKLESTNILNNKSSILNYSTNISKSNISNNKNRTNYEYAGFNVINDLSYNIENNFLNNETNLSAPYPGTYIIDSYLGSTNENIIRKNLRDFLNYPKCQGIIDLSQRSNLPFVLNHGIVWKVLVNGKDAQDEYELMDPVGVGTHQFQVYFNREMDRTRPPQISYGVREPYNQKIISETGTWSPDGKIYSVNHEVKIGAADGINRIRVEGARDLDYFDIPIEDMRFNMLVQSAGSASAGFMATPGLGKIGLEWDRPDETYLSDILGYNMYRHEPKADGTFTDPVKINNQLIPDPAFTDFNVVEGKNYYYQYKILRTSLEETDYSKTVMSTPLTSKLGDSNGDFSVNVMDLVHNVDYILGNNPQPFIFKAGDVNADLKINVLDVVGIVDIILNPSAGRIAKGSKGVEYISSTPVGDALFFWQGDDLMVTAKEAIGGLQLSFEQGFTYTKAVELNTMEWLDYTQDGQQMLMLFSFDGKSIPAGTTKLLTRNSGGTIDIDKAVVGTAKGLKLNALFEDKTVKEIEAPVQLDQPTLLHIAPNPTQGEVNIRYYMPEQVDKVVVQVYNLQGTRVWMSDVFKNTPGQTDASINLSHLKDGIYLMVMDVIRNGELKKREVKKLIINKK